MRILTVLLVLLLTACFPHAMDSDIDACPVKNLISVNIYDGKPPAGTRVAPDGITDIETTWVLPKTKNGTYLMCEYRDGFEKIQILPRFFSACAVTYDAATGEIQRLHCRGSM